MKKKIITIAVALMLTGIPAMAQIFMTDEEMVQHNNRCAHGTTSFDVDLPGYYNSGEDWYTPVGGGSLLWVGLAGAYLLGKRRKKKE